MLSSKLHSNARFLREKAARGEALTPTDAQLLAHVLEDLAERVSLIEMSPVPPAGRVVDLRRVA